MRWKSWWDRHRRALLWAAVLLLAATAAGRLAVQIPRLIRGGPEVFGAVDLGYRYREVQHWFAGRPVYGALDTAIYPPATYPLLWPFLGWTSWAGARLLWAATGVASLAALSLLIQRASAARDRPTRLLALLIAPAYYATGVTLAAGQMGVHLLPLLVAGVLLLYRPEAGWKEDATGAGLLLLSLVKPNFSLLFLGLALLPRSMRKAGGGSLSREAGEGRGGGGAVRLRPLLLLATGYAGLTLVALAFQPFGPRELFEAWLPTARGVAAISGYGHLAVWLAAAGLEGWLLPASVTVALGLAVWLWLHRGADPWLLLGVTAIVSRVWTYHQYYDDVLLLLPIAAALRLANLSPSAAERYRAGAAVALALLANCLPTWLHFQPSPWDLLYEVPQMSAWTVLLVVIARGSRRGAGQC